MRTLSKDEVTELHILSQAIRRNILHMVAASKSSHVGSAFSIVEILVVLYKLILKNNNLNPNDPQRDRFLLSKGHGCSAVYSILAELGYFDKELLKEFSRDGSVLMSHINYDVPGVEFSTGSLGHALPIGLGMSLAAKTRQEKWRTFVLLSDGELNEGSNWEAFLTAPHLSLESLIAIIDCNGIQGLGLTKDVISMEPLDEKFKAFGWEVERIDGHDYNQLFETINKLVSSRSKKPKIIIADTIKGKGVSFMENKIAWHYKSPSDEELVNALKELEN